MQTKEKDDLEVLFPEVEVHGYKLRPWSLKTWAELGPFFSKAISVLVAKPGKDGELTLSEIIPLILDDLPVFVAKSAGISVEEAANLPGPLASEMISVIYEQNEPAIKNFFSRIVKQKFTVRPKMS